MTNPTSFGTIQKIAHPNITSGIPINKFDLPTSHESLSRYLHLLESQMDDSVKGMADRFDTSNGYTLLMSPTLVEDHRQQGQEGQRRMSSPPPMINFRERLAFIFDDGQTYLINFNPEFVQQFNVMNGNPGGAYSHGPNGNLGPHGPGVVGGYGNFGNPQQGPAPWLQQLGYILSLLKYAATDETHASGYKGFAK